MKKFVFILLSYFVFYSAGAVSPADFLNKVPENFKPYCYEYYFKIDKSNLEENKVYKLNLNKNDLVFTQNWFILPYQKFFALETKIANFNYSNSKNYNFNYLNDDNFKTYVEFDTDESSELIISLDKNTIANDFVFNFDFISDNYDALYYISLDNKNFSLVNKQNISDFSFKYLKIKFNSKFKHISREIIKISELSFKKLVNRYLLKSFYDDNIEIYSNFNCVSKDFSTNFKYYNQFEIDNNTKIFDIILEKNPKYNVYDKSDIDNDWVEDSIDNCKNYYNPDQKDSNWDWVGDICIDDDQDWIIGYYDNCIYVSNRDQKDVNNNGIWDVCEFDKDLDWIFDSKDNCINKANSDQTDTDKDWIGDICDNCEYYNPSQIDKNSNWIWDVCDDRIKNLELNDDDKDWILNSLDNCKLVYNPNQEDIDKDSIWDSCDNCKNIVNPNQEDSNKNWVWDMCEDSDNDWYLWYLDNCINITNADQLDDDNNWIWNACEDKDWDNILFINDNCPFEYNSDQSDIDKDKIWDACDDKDDRYIESNKWFFIGLLVLITIVFGVWIFFMIKKLK